MQKVSLKMINGGQELKDSVDQFGTQLAEKAQQIEVLDKRSSLPNIVSLIAGTEDETFTVSPSGGLKADNVNYKIGGQAWKVTRSIEGGTHMLTLNFPGGMEIPPWQAVDVWFYVEDATKFTDVGIYLYFDESYTTPNRWARSMSSPPAQAIVDGWNLFRVPIDFSVNQPADMSKIYRASVYAISNAASSVTFGHLFLEAPEKAKVLVVADRGYQKFYEGLYQDLKERNIPVTWAVDVTLFGTGTIGGATEAISEDLLHQVAKENGNSISFHGYDGAPTASMTAAELRADTVKSIKWLQRHGYEGRMWRAAFVQSTAPFWESVRGLLVGSADGTSVARHNPWPPLDMHKIHRETVDNLTTTTASLDDRFERLKKTHMLEVVFVHSEDETRNYDYSNALRQHFLTKLDTAIGEGWLECVTFEQLFRESGGNFYNLGGANVATYTNPDGTFVTKNVL